MNQATNLTYTDAGVNYKNLDPFKRASQIAARETSFVTEQFGCVELEWSRGESVYLFTLPDGRVIGHTEEGLGTKSIDALEMYKLTGLPYFSRVSQDTVAMIVNDMATVGMQPMSIAMHLAVGDDEVLKDPMLVNDLVDGWKQACLMANAAWGGGETPTLKGIVKPGQILLSGSAVGYVTDEDDLWHPENIEDGNVIVIIESSGIHANGLSLARKIITDRMPQKYLTRLSSGRYIGDVLLDPTHIYVPLVMDCVDSGLFVNYSVNITGHGWAKFMRAEQPFEYVIQAMPEEQELFRVLQAYGNVEEKEMYKTFNMGAGFAFFVEEEHADDVIAKAKARGFRAFRAGYISAAKKKRVVIEPKGIVFTEEDLEIR